MKRRSRRIKFASTVWRLQSLFPVDFLDLAVWPFARYRLAEDKKQEASEPKRDWKIKPKETVKHEAALASAIRRALGLGAGVAPGDYERIKADENLHLVLLSEIYALTYNLTPIEKYLTPVKPVALEYAELIAAKAKAYRAEPWSLVADVSRETPELYNPERWDFNLFILGVGWEQERQAIEKAQREADAKARSVRGRR